MPIECGPGPSSDPETPILVTLDICNRGGAGIAAANVAPCITQVNFVLARFESSTYDLIEQTGAVAAGYLEEIEKPPQV